MLDIVYPYKHKGGHELRYSLRSLVNLPHRRVFIAGDCPDWTQHVTHVAVRQGVDKYGNSLANILAACQRPDLSDDFVLMNDDFFVLSPQEEIPAYHQGDLQTYIETRSHRDSYLDLAAATKSLLDEEGVTDSKFYGIHIPTILNKHRVIELSERFSGKPIMLRTLYHNIYGSGGIQRADVKKYNMHDRITETDYLSTSDGYARLPMFKSFIGKLFPQPCYYEKHETVHVST